jgi:hypothetical protein
MSDARTEAETRTLCRRYANEFTDNIREHNIDWANRTGEPIRVSEAEYENCRDELEAIMLRVAGLRRG